MSTVPFSGDLDEVYRQIFGGGGKATPLSSDAAPAAPEAAVKSANPVPGMDVPGVPTQPSSQPSYDMVKDAMASSNTRMPVAPPQDPQLPDLINQRQQAGNPLDRTNPRYHMGFKERLMGTLANFASGVAGGGVIKKVGPGAMNRNYYNDEADRETRVKNLDTTIGNREKLDESNRKMFDSAVKQSYESQLAGARQDTAAARQQTADAQQTAADARKQLADQKGKNPIDERIATANRIGLTGDDRKMYIANGKLPEEKNMTPYQREQLRLEREKFEFEKTKGSTGRGGSGSGGKGTPTFKDRAAVDKYSDGYYRAERGKVEQQKKNFKALHPDASDEELQAGYKAIEDEYQGRANDFEQRKKGYYSEFDGGNGQSAAAAAAPAQPQPAQSQPAGKQYKYVTKPNQQGVRLGSDDGKNWFEVTTGKAYGGR